MNYFDDDPQRSTGRVREHPGEAIEDSRNWPGYALVGIAIVTLGMALVAAGYGFQGWAWIAGTICALSLVIGPMLVLREHRRIRRLDDLGLPDGLGY